MPTNKDFKRLIRGRMQKTGESYTAARANLLTKPAPQSAPRRYAGTAVTPAPAEYARIAGMSDAVVKAKTGCTWERWVYALDRARAYEWPHSEIARYVREKYRTPSWWTQMVTVGYERIKGLRVKGQGRDGGFETNKSRTFAVPLTRLYRAFSDKRARALWLAGINYTLRSATPGKYMRIVWHDRTLVQVGFTGKGVGKSQVQIQHGNFPDKASALRMKEFWAERLEALEGVLQAANR